MNNSITLLTSSGAAHLSFDHVIHVKSCQDIANARRKETSILIFERLGATLTSLEG
jgi:hypothetical protein